MNVSEEPTFSPPLALASARVAVVGLGLMGASLAMDLRSHCTEIVGVSRSPGTLSYAIENDIVDRIVDFNAALKCDLVVLAAPVRTIIQQLEQISREIDSQNTTHTVIIDLGSTKADIVAAMENLPPCFDPIGGHPMCGKEVSGIRNAETGLYQDQTFILTPLERTSPMALALVDEMISIIGAHKLVLTPERQDTLVAMISHLPYTAACALVRAAIAQNDEQLWKVAASGFRDTSRVAAGDITMFVDIMMTNQVAVIDALKAYRSEIDTIIQLIAAGDEEKLRAALKPAQRQRAKMFL